MWITYGNAVTGLSSSWQRTALQFRAAPGGEANSVDVSMRRVLEAIPLAVIGSSGFVEIRNQPGRRGQRIRLTHRERK